DQVRWRGQPTSCVAVLLPPAQLEALGFEPPRRAEPQRHLRIGVTDAHVVDLVRRLDAQASEELQLGPLYVEGLSLALASYVHAHFVAERASTPAPGPSLSLSQRERLVAMIEARLTEPLPLNELAADVGYSPDYFMRLFSYTFGVSPHRYITSRRVERAKALLRERDTSLVEVALACGFSSQAHFSTVFKLHTGMTPGKYRTGGPLESERSSPRASARHVEPSSDEANEEMARGVGLSHAAAAQRLVGTCPATLGALIDAGAEL
ncbi:MAG TPA: AraC family transcriptional regulator, partial [Polyangiaceae bacterium]|nr:AraC family transcriptional regulator [Polyangiaceae bacterium]